MSDAGTRGNRLTFEACSSKTKTAARCGPPFEKSQAGVLQFLKGIPLEEMDARLLTVAIFNKYDVFLTRDCKSILKHQQKIHSLFPEIKVMKPSELLAHLCHP